MGRARKKEALKEEEETEMEGREGEEVIGEEANLGGSADGFI